MTLRFLGGDTGGGGSPRLYQEEDDYLVQGYVVTEPKLLRELKIPDGETVVRVPRSLWAYLPAGPRSERSNKEVLTACGHNACHLQVLDWHAAEREDGRLATWQAGMFDLARASAARRCWLDLTRAATGRDATVRGGRIVAGAVTEFIRFEGYGTSYSIEAGEQVRWLRRLTRDGTRAGSEMASAAPLARECMSAFDAVWAISAPHGGYGPD